MKVLLHTAFHRNSELVDIIKNNSLLSTKLKYVPEKKNFIISNTIDTETEEFDVFTKIARNDLPIKMTPIMKYTPNELSLFDYYELGVSSVLRQRTIDVELNKLEFNNTPFVYPTSTSRIKLIEKIFLADVPIRSDTIYCFEQYHEFVFGRGVKEIFEKANLSGFGVKPIINTTRKEAYTDFYQLYTQAILPPVHEDFTMFEKVLSEGEKLSRENTRCISVLGAEVYDTAGKTFCDFNRTAEGFICGWSPLWIVSKRVKQIYDYNKLKGLLFRPVFQIGTPQYEEYIRKWTVVFEKVGQNPHIKLMR